MDRQRFENALAAELARWEELLGTLTEEQALAPAAIDAWSVRDVVVHAAFWTHHAAAHLVAIVVLSGLISGTVTGWLHNRLVQPTTASPLWWRLLTSAVVTAATHVLVLSQYW